MNISDTITEICKKLEEDDGIGNKSQLTETVAWLLFLKCADMEEKEHAEQSEIIGEDYSLVISDKFQWDYWASHQSKLSGAELLKFISDELFPALKKVEGESNLAQVTRSVFQNATVYPKSGYKIKDCVEILNRDINQESLGERKIQERFDKLLYQMTASNSKEHPRLFTPRPLCFLLVKLLNPQMGQKVYDPACGTAGLLINAYFHLSSQAKTPTQLGILKEKTFYGREKRDLQYMLGVINCYLHGISRPNLERGNTLSINLTQMGSEDKYDIILCNPTFDSDEGEMVQNNFSIATSSVELMFLQHVEKSLRNKGKAAIILPEGVFFKTDDQAYTLVKEKLFKKVNVHTIISLPQIGVKTSILLFDKTGKTTNVWMYEFVVPEGVKLTKKSGYKQEYFDDLLKKYSTREESENSKIVEKSEIVKKDYNISVSAYIEDSQDEQELLEPTEYLDQIDTLLDQSKEKVGELKQELKESPCKKAN